MQPFLSDHLCTAPRTGSCQYCGFPLPCQGLTGSLVPWNAMMGMGLVELFGNGKRMPLTGAIAEIKLDSSEANREQKRPPREKPTQRIRLMSMSTLFTTSRSTDLVYMTSSGPHGTDRPCDATLRFRWEPCNAANANCRSLEWGSTPDMRRKTDEVSLLPGARIQSGSKSCLRHPSGTCKKYRLPFVKVTLWLYPSWPIFWGSISTVCSATPRCSFPISRPSLSSLAFVDALPSAPFSADAP
mmetsp:Transcript_112690/g.224149  ORF Transcript_112690/g.224149 Transcript_112690/m.224149 type:complete len:242 (+) Transcript_112690:841-1566(+)